MERITEEMFQIAAVGIGDVRQRRAVDHHQRRIHAALVRVAQLRPHGACAWRLLPQHGRYDYVPLPERKDYSWPGGKRLAFCITTNIEWFAFGAGLGHDPAKTAESFRGGWCSVGDMAYSDADGYIHLVDRKSNMIISGGENVYPSEVEAVIAAHPAVKDVAVIGVPHDTWGEAVHAVVIFHDGRQASREQPERALEPVRRRERRRPLRAADPAADVLRQVLAHAERDRSAVPPRAREERQSERMRPEDPDGVEPVQLPAERGSRWASICTGAGNSPR